MGNWNSNQWSEEVIEGVGNTLGKDSMVYFEQQIEALDMAQQMLQSGECFRRSYWQSSALCVSLHTGSSYCSFNTEE